MKNDTDFEKVSNLTLDDNNDSYFSLPSWVLYLETFYLSIIMLIGIPGNVMIILVQKRNRDRSSTDYLIVVMAAYELVCSSLNAAVKIIMNTRLWLYIASDHICRLHLFLTYITTFSSTYLLAAVAIDRYVKTCKPLSNICSRQASKRICVTIAFVGFLTGISSLFVFELDDRIDCSVSIEHKQFQSIWDMVIIASTAIVLAIFIFSYVNIAVTLRKRVRVRNRKKKQRQETSNNQPRKFTLNGILRKIGRGKVVPTTETVRAADTSVFTSSGTNRPPSNCADDGESSQRESCFSSYRVLEERPVHHGNARAANRPATLAEETVNRTTLMLFLLTVIYAVTFTFTNIFVMTADAILGRVLEKLCKSLLMINCITNPVFFFCMSSKYRTSAKRLLFRRRP